MSGPILPEMSLGQELTKSSCLRREQNQIVNTTASLSPQARSKLRCLRPAALAIRLAFARRFPVTLVLAAPLTRRNHFLIRANLTRTPGLYTGLLRDSALRLQVELRRFEDLRSPGRPPHRRVETADEYSVRTSHRLIRLVQQIL